MVFCKLKSKTGSTLIYALGGDTNDMTGEVVVNITDMSYEVTRKPEKTTVFDRHIGKMLRLNAKELQEGIAKPKMSYEF